MFVLERTGAACRKATHSSWGTVEGNGFGNASWGGFEQMEEGI
jgi:hypothetical protein